MSTPRSYAELFSELERRFAALSAALGEARDLAQAHPESHARFDEFVTALEPAARHQIERLRFKSVANDGREAAAPLVAAAGRLTLNAVRGRVLSAVGELADDVRLYAGGADDASVAVFWERHVLARFRRMQPSEFATADRESDLVLAHAAACRCLARVAAEALTGDREPGEDPASADYRPAGWFVIETSIPLGRLRQAAVRQRKDKKVRKLKEGGVVYYSAADACRYWPQDMKPPSKR